MQIIPLVVYAVYGVCIGSFLNVVIYRLPIGMPIAHGRSICPQCGHQLAAKDLVPVVSFLALGGKCRYCGAPISPRYPGVELLTASAFALCGGRYGFTGYGVILALYCAVLITAWFIDLDHTYIPDRLQLAVALLAAASLRWGPSLPLADRLWGGLGLGAGMFLLSYLTGGGIGGGDIKLLALSGLLLGWKLAVPAFFLAYILAAARCLPAILQKKVERGQEIPMAPYFALALMIMALFGEDLLRFYFSLWG